MEDIKGRVALVTGGSRGIGKAVSLALARAGANVVINYHKDKAAAEQTCREAQLTGCETVAIMADISDKNQAEKLISQTISQFGRLDIIINNAGVWQRTPINEKPFSEVEKMLNVNLMGTFYTIMSAVPHLIKQKSGNIINISSTSAQRGEAYYSAYSAAKGAVISLTKSLALELAPHNIRVNCVAPGWVKTDMSREALKAETGDEITGQIPLGRVADPAEIAGPILFLASKMSSYVTGEILNVNGGSVSCG